ncbi:MAG: ATP-binding cassette domain-containing protein [Phycisphaerales bacterium]|nr:ATP-binding cassette domain-containing protein [Phycisphaerales bacterium]
MDIHLDSVDCVLPGDVRALQSCTLSVPSGSWTLIVGPNGCGKTTLLRVIAGLESPARGVVRLGGQDMADVEPHLRGVAMVLQDAPLYPHMSVIDNLKFVLEMHGRRARPRPAQRVRRAALLQRARHVLELLELQHCQDRRPDRLSGGERQRAALGRALVLDPPVYLLDEPLSDLDAASRGGIISALCDLHNRGRTLVQVTHQLEVMRGLGDQVVHMEAGAVTSIGTAGQ